MSTPGTLVLVVEDDNDIRSLLSLALPLYGFTVLAACAGAEALERCRRHPESIGLAVLDVRMPGLSGPETLVALREIHPRCGPASSRASRQSKARTGGWKRLAAGSSPSRSECQNW
jgi:CheY-like chemotaxis protein